MRKSNFAYRVYIMWNTTLKISVSQQLISLGFYIGLILIVIMQLADTTFNSFSFILVLLAVVEWWRSWRYCQTIKGELALFHYIDQIYWHHQRWYLMRKPLLLRYLVILNLKSRRNGKRRTLFLMCDSFKPDDWRTLHYYLQQIELN